MLVANVQCPYACSSAITDVTVAVTITCTGSYYNGSTSDELKAESREIKVVVPRHTILANGFYFRSLSGYYLKALAVYCSMEFFAGMRNLCRSFECLHFCLGAIQWLCLYEYETGR